MIEVRVFATLRQGRDKVTLLSPEGIACAGDILDRMNISQEEVSILLINGFHHKPESEVKDGDIARISGIHRSAASHRGKQSHDVPVLHFRFRLVMKTVD